MLDYFLLVKFLVALALGILIGLEREYHRHKIHGHYFAGIRTFPLIALLGALSAYLGDTISVWLLIIGLLLVGSLIVAAYFKVPSKLHAGTTSEVAGMLTFIIGILCYYNKLTIAVVLAIFITLILYSRPVLHHFAEKIKKQELSSTIKFAVIAFVILPFLPDQNYGPLQIFNPYHFWLMVVFVSGMSFIGYIILKWVGQKGLTLTGALGGLVSSTIVTSSFAERSRKEQKIYKALVLGVILANAILLIRVLVLTFVLNRSLFNKLLLPLSLLSILIIIFSYFLWKNSQKIPGHIHLDSPFTLTFALKFSIFLALVLALTKVASTYFNSQGLYLVSFLAGFADADAITISLSNLAQSDISTNIAINGIFLALISNTIAKSGIGLFFGGKQFGKLLFLFYSILTLALIALIIFF